MSFLATIEFTCRVTSQDRREFWHSAHHSCRPPRLQPGPAPKAEAADAGRARSGKRELFARLLAEA